MQNGSNRETRTVDEVSDFLEWPSSPSSPSAHAAAPVVGSRRISRSADCSVSHSSCSAAASACFSAASAKSRASAARFISIRVALAFSRSVCSSTRRFSSAARSTLSSSDSEAISRLRRAISSSHSLASLYLPVSAAAFIARSAMSRLVPASSSSRRVSMTFCVSFRSNRAEVASSSRKDLKNDSRRVVLPRPASPTTIRLNDSRPGSRDVLGSTQRPW
mmetsp:Transcript_33055/g.109224  ORF Transcript_33055/g.109224 Transcript_33055/m.109224 type:complete len:219 (+) Transcript_33055:723-1379(+)